MLNDLPIIYWDACVPLSYVNGMNDRIQHIDPMMVKSGTDFQIITSVLSVVEVAFAKMEQDNKALDPATEERIAKLWQPGSPIKIVEFYELIAKQAQALMRAAIIRGWSLKAADAIHLATADQLRASEFQTYDDKLDKYSDLTSTKFTIGRPICATPILPLTDAIGPLDEDASSQFPIDPSGNS